MPDPPGDGAVPDATAVASQARSSPERVTDALVRSVRRGAPTIIAICLLTAIAMHRYVGMANADAVLPALMSTQEWTLYYWGQDRLANLVPLVTMPVRDPVWNFRVQSLVIGSAFFGVGAAFVSYHAWSRSDRLRPVEHATATALTGLLVMLPFHTVAGYRFVVEQLYFVSVLVWVAAVWLWNRHERYLAGGILLQVTTLVNPSMLLASPIVWLLDDRPEGRLRRSGGFVAAAVGAFVVNDVAARLFATGDEAARPYDEFRLDQLRTGARAAAGNIAGSVRDNLATVVVIAAVGAVGWSARRLRARTIGTYVVLPLFSGVWFLAFSTNGWVSQNLYEFRYFYPLYVAFMLYVAGAVTEVLLRSRSWRRPLDLARTRSTGIAAFESVAALAAAAVAVVVVHATPVAALEDTTEPVATAREFEARLIAGNYWTTWPVVVAGRSDGAALLGVTYRSDPIVEEIRDELDTAAARGSGTVLCSGVDPVDCVALVNERDDQVWSISEVLREWPLVIRIVPET